MRYSIWLFVFVLASVVIIGRVGFAQQSVDAGAITGCVYYTEVAVAPGAAAQSTAPRTRMPIAGAEVTVSGVDAHTVTDKAGQFTLRTIPAGMYNVTVMHRRFRDAVTAPVEVKGGKTASVQAEMGQGYYLAVGVGNYADRKIQQLVGPAYDVKAIDRALFRNFQGHTTILLDKQATRERIQAAIEDAAARMSPRDFFVFYFSGHGGSDKTNDKDDTRVDFLLPYNSGLDDYSCDIKAEDLSRWLHALPDPHRAMVILDSCESGAFFNGKLRREKGIRGSDNTSCQLQNDLGCTVLSAADYDENSVDCDDGSLFTNKIVEGLRRKREVIDVDHNHEITAKELFDYAAPKTTSEATKEYDEIQHPQFQDGANPVLLRY